jgi:hypothetical protein
MENSHQQNEPAGVYEKMKNTPPELRTPKELSEAIKQDIRCAGLVPKGMKVEGMPALSKQEIEDIRLVSDAKYELYEKNAFSRLPVERRTEAVSQAALNADVGNFHEIPDAAMSDELIKSALQKRGKLFFVIREDRMTPEICMTAVENYGLSIIWIPKEILTREMVLKAIEQNSWALAYVPDDMKTPELCRTALSNSLKPEAKDRYSHPVISEVPFSDVCFEHLKKIVRENGDPYWEFSHIHPDVMTPEMAKWAVGVNSRCFVYVPEHLITPEICTLAVEKDWKNMRFVPENLKTEELCLQAVKSNPDAKEFVPENLRKKATISEKTKINGNNPPEKKQPEKMTQKPVKRKGMKM